MKSACIALMDAVGQVEAERITVDSSAWESIVIPALVDLDKLIPAAYNDPLEFANMMKCLAAAIYTLGYKRGKLDARMPQFIVKEE